MRSFTDLCMLCERLEATFSRTSQIEMVATFLRETDSPEGVELARISWLREDESAEEVDTLAKVEKIY